MSSHSIYHSRSIGTMGRMIRLNLRAVRKLLEQPELEHFRDLTEADREKLQRRFSIYCQRSSNNILSGEPACLEKGTPEVEPSIDHLPHTASLRLAILEIPAPLEPTRTEKQAARKLELQRKIWDLHKLGRKPVEIATDLDISLGSVYTHRKRASVIFRDPPTGREGKL